MGLWRLVPPDALCLEAPEATPGALLVGSLAREAIRERGRIHAEGRAMFKSLTLGVALLWLFHSPQGAKKDTHSASLGDVQVTVTATRIASDQDIQRYRLHPRAGYYVVLVFLRVKNVARYPSCSDLDEWLQVKQGYEYPRSSGFKMKAPDASNVLPTEESSGEFAFEIKAGTEPASLKLVRNTIGEELCAMFQHRDTSVSGPESVSLSLVGLPANAEQSFAQQVQPPTRKAHPPAAAKQKIEVEEQQSNVIMMNDGFEYGVIDYGVGRIQVRNQGARNTTVPETRPRFHGPILPKPKELSDFTEQVFWVKFQITNKAEHLIGKPRYFPSVLNALRVTDNWGNVYSLRYPNAADVGGTWFGAELPIPVGSERREQYKPHESSSAVRLIPAEQLVAQVEELRIYLSHQSDYPKVYFKIEEPLSRQRDLLRSQADTKPDGLSVKVVTERKAPAGR
jgi:hypothetical protein